MNPGIADWLAHSCKDTAQDPVEQRGNYHSCLPVDARMDKAAGGPQPDAWHRVRRVLDGWTQEVSRFVDRNRRAVRTSMTLLMAGSACATVYLLHRSASRHFTTAASVWKEYIMRQKPLRGRLVHVQLSGVLRFQHVPAYTRVWELLRLENTKPASMSDTMRLKLLGAMPTAEGAEWLRKHVLDRQVVLTPVGRSSKWQDLAQGGPENGGDPIIIGTVERRGKWLLWRSDVAKELVQQGLAVLDEEIVIGEETSQRPSDVRRTVKYIEQLSQQEQRRRWIQYFQRWFGRSKQR